MTVERYCCGVNGAEAGVKKGESSDKVGLGDRDMGSLRQYRVSLLVAIADCPS
jgi:hypothetical protein